jgi:hypothetical protein
MRPNAMSRLVFALLLSCAAVSFAKPWQGLRPGQSGPLDVIGKFGDPTRKVDVKGHTVLIYSGLEAITGTVQVQFKLSPGGDTVARIDVYPQPVIDTAAVEQSYGPKCDAKKPVEPCYFLKEGDGKKPYLVYVKLGLAVFFKEDGKTVQSFAFLPEKS